jgi:hypothetical protein
MYIRGFNAAYFSSDGRLFADMAAFNDNPRGIAWFNLGTTGADYQIKLDDEALKSTGAHQYGRYLLLRHYSDRGEKGSIEVRDVISKATLWTRDFNKALPRIAGDDRSGKLLLVFARDTAKNEGKRDTSLQALMPEFNKNKERVQLVEILDAATGKAAGSLSINASGVPDIVVAGDRVLVTSPPRTVAYSITTRQEIGAIFATNVEAHAEQSLIAALNDPWHLSLYDLNTLAKKDEFTFASPVAATRFTRAGDKLLVLTRDQTLYVLNTSGVSKVIQATGAKN